MSEMPFGIRFDGVATLILLREGQPWHLFNTFKNVYQKVAPKHVIGMISINNNHVQCQILLKIKYDYFSVLALGLRSE